VSTGAFSDQLETWLRRDGEKTLGGLAREFGEKSFAAAVLVLMFVPACQGPRMVYTEGADHWPVGLGRVGAGGELRAPA
jgi:hypothetical protein